MKKRKKIEDPPAPEHRDCPDCLKVGSISLDYYGDGTWFCEECGSEWSTPEWDHLTRKARTVKK